MLEKILEFINKIASNPILYFAIALASGFLLIANSQILFFLGYDTIINQIRLYIGSVFVVSIAIIIIKTISIIFPWVKNKVNSYLIKKRGFNRLHKLTPEEKEIFLGYILENTRTQFFSSMDGVVIGLKNEGFINQAINASNLKGIPYNIYSWVWDYLIKNREKIFSDEDINSYKECEMSPSDKSKKRVDPFWGLKNL